MRLLLLTIALTLACGQRKNTKAEASILDEAQPIWRNACLNYAPAQTQKCDRSTFVAWMSVACNRDFGIQDYKKAPGVYWRDTSDCYGQGESRSQCSRDAYLGIIFYSYVHGDYVTLNEIYDYGRDNDWTMCQGAESATNIKDLSYILSSILGKKEKGLITNPLAGFRGHLLAGYLWLDAYHNKGSLQQLLLKQLHHDTNDSPYFSALYHRYSDDDDQSGTLSRMRSVPEETGAYGWGGSPYQFHQAASYMVMRGFE